MPSFVEKLRQNQNLFRNLRVLVMGDIALDRTFCCQKAGEGSHAKHGHEDQFDITSDDFGAVGTANNYCLFFRGFNVHPTLITAFGNDDEGRTVDKLLKAQGLRCRLFSLEGVQTVTRLRFFVSSPETGRSQLLFRMNKDPNCSLSYSRFEEVVFASDFFVWLGNELKTADAFVLNDTEKGIFSDRVVAELSKVVVDENADRAKQGRARLVTLIDPKHNWRRFAGFPVSVMKSNHREAAVAVGTPDCFNLPIITRLLHEKFGHLFPDIVTTWGAQGATWLHTASSREAKALHFAACKVFPSTSQAATHCGDMFGAAIVLAMLLPHAFRGNLTQAIQFANYCGAMQFASPAGEKISERIILRSSCLSRLRSARPTELWELPPPRTGPKRRQN